MKPAERQILDFIEQYIEEHGYSPSVSEITLGAGYKSRGSVHSYIESLISQGELLREAGVQRGLSVPRRAIIPMLGRIAAGMPIEAIPESECVDFYDRLDEPDLYQLLVCGDSMIEAGINDGDTVLIKKCNSAPNGAIVVALVEDHEATLKRIYQRDGKVILKAENPAYKAMTYRPEQVRIQGVLFCLARFYH